MIKRCVMMVGLAGALSAGTSLKDTLADSIGYAVRIGAYEGSLQTLDSLSGAVAKFKRAGVKPSWDLVLDMLKGCRGEIQSLRDKEYRP